MGSKRTAEFRQMCSSAVTAQRAAVKGKYATETWWENRVAQNEAVNKYQLDKDTQLAIKRSLSSRDRTLVGQSKRQGGFGPVYASDEELSFNSALKKSGDFTVRTKLCCPHCTVEI